MKEFVDFLGGQSPYDALDATDLERLATAVEAEFFPAGATVVEADSDPLTHLWVVRTGAVEVLDRGRVVDQLGPGDTFGHVSVLSGLPPALTVRAAQDSLCYRLPDPRTVLAHPQRLRFHHYGALITRDALTQQNAGLRDRALLPVSRYARSVVTCPPHMPARQVSALISAARQSCAVVTFPDGLGIVTDADFRARVGSGEVSVDAPIHLLATRPVLTVREDTSVATAFLEMLEHGVHHLVVCDTAGRPAGVVRVVDLASSDVRDPLVVRAAVEAATSLDALREAVGLLGPTAVELYDTGVPALRVGGSLAAVLDAVLRRLLALSEHLPQPPEPTTDGFVGGPDQDRDAGRGDGLRVSWLVLGSLARREVLPTSDVDTAIVWDDGAGGAVVYGTQVEAAVRLGASRILDDLEKVGLKRCADGANADTPRFSRSLTQWTAATTSWLRDAGTEGALLLSTMLADSRPVTQLSLGRAVTDAMAAAVRPPQFLNALLEYTLSARPPTGFVRDFVVEHSGEHRGELNLKRGGLRPVTSLGRWAAVVTGDTSGTTPDRLRRAADAGLLSVDESESLVGAFEQVYGLLLTQEVEAIRSGAVASTYLAPARLDSLTRRHLRESFRAIAQVQSRLESQWRGQIPGLAR